MTLPIRVLGAPKVVDPMSEDTAKTPAKAPVPAASEASAASPLRPVATGSLPPAPQQASVVAPAEPAQTPEAPSAPFLPRFHLQLGGGYIFKAKFAPEADVYNRAAPTYSGELLSGLMFFIQPSYSVMETAGFQFRLGADLKARFLSIPQQPGSVDSSITATSLGALAEGDVNFGENVGLGLNVALGYMGLSSTNADVGAPYSATFNWSKEGGLYIGPQAYVHFARNSFRVGGGVDLMPGGFGLATSPGNPDLKVNAQPMFSVFVGGDIPEFIRGGSVKSKQGN